MSGLPGSGKDTWIRRWLPDVAVVSLDAIREELDAPSTGAQGKVIQRAREKSRELLRQRRDFVWNATNLSREMRGQLVDLFVAYGAKVRIVYVEASMESLHCQNRNRVSVVPERAMTAMMDRWEVPTSMEADHVEWWVGGASIKL